MSDIHFVCILSKFTIFIICPSNNQEDQRYSNVMLVLIIISDLSSNLKYQVYGQHLVLKAVVRHLKAHLSNDKPSKALALSFHGGTGTGKNHVSKIIANHVYKEGMKSKFVHMIASTNEFPHVDMVPLYKVCCLMICK